MNPPKIEGADVPIEMTLRTELSRKGLIALRQRIDELLEHLPEDVGGPATRSEGERAADKATATWQRLGADSTRSYLVACARLAQDGDDFTIEDVAAATGESRPKVMAYHRNISRSAGAAEPRDVAIITSRKAGGRTRLSMSQSVSRTILSLSQGGH